MAYDEEMERKREEWAQKPIEDFADNIHTILLLVWANTKTVDDALDDIMDLIWG